MTPTRNLAQLGLLSASAASPDAAAKTTAGSDANSDQQPIDELSESLLGTVCTKFSIHTSPETQVFGFDRGIVPVAKEWLGLLNNESAKALMASIVDLVEALPDESAVMSALKKL